MEQARQILMHYSGPSAYAAFYLMVMGCGMGFPMNSDFCLVTAAVLAAIGFFELKFLIPLAFLALMAGDSVVFFIGRKWGRCLLAHRPFSLILSEKKLDQAEYFFKTKGEKYIFLVRFLPFVRTALFFTAGSLKVRPKIFYLMNACATALYLPLVMGCAFYAATHMNSQHLNAMTELFKELQKVRFFA